MEVVVPTVGFMSLMKVHQLVMASLDSILFISDHMSDSL